MEDTVIFKQFYLDGFGICHGRMRLSAGLYFSFKNKEFYQLRGLAKDSQEIDMTQEIICVRIISTEICFRVEE